jgi:hypothetical protein
MKPSLLLPVAVALLLAGSMIPWWRVTEMPSLSTSLLISQECRGDAPEDCRFGDEDSPLASARHWTLVIGLVTASLLIALIAAPIGSRLRTHLASAGVIASAAALVMGLAVACALIIVGIELERGYPGLGPLLFLGGAILGLRTTRRLAAGEPAA